jgi:hypothetical protein
MCWFIAKVAGVVVSLSFLYCKYVNQTDRHLSFLLVHSSLGFLLFVSPFSLLVMVHVMGKASIIMIRGCLFVLAGWVMDGYVQ